MPPVIIAVAGAAAGTFLASAAAIAGTGAFLGFAAGTASAFFAKAFVVNLVLGAVSQGLAKKSQPTPAALSQRGQAVSVREPVAPHQIIYGRTRVGGTIVYIEGTESNKYLHIVVALAGHEIDAVEEVYFNDEIITLDGGGMGYDGYARVKFGLGTAGQAAFADLVAESDGKWTADHRLQGVACAYIRLEYNADKWPNGIPSFSFVVRGKKVFDPRSGATAWSQNPALCLNDYLTNNTYGLGVTYATEVDQAALIAAANVCDESVPSIAGTETRYLCNGSFTTAQTPESVINSLLTSMAGKAIYTSGVWRILPGVYYTPTLTFDEGDLRGGIRVQSLVSRRENFNAVKGVFSSASDRYIATDFPPVISDTYIAQDGGEAVYKSIELPWTTSPSMAQRLAKIDLLRARQQITVTMPLNLSGLQAAVGDVVLINNGRMGWSAKPFEVVGLQMALETSLGVDLELREISPDVYSWSTSEETPYDPAPNTNLPNPFSSVPPGITVSDRLQIINEQVATVLVVDVSGGDAFLSSYEVQAKLQTDADWINLGQATGNRFELPFVQDGSFYDVRARSVNTLGVRSAWSTGSWQPVGQTLPPQDVQGFAINIVGTEAHLTWTAVTDLDLSHYKVRYSSLTSGATYSDAIDLIPRISRPATFATVPAATGTYFIKAFDKQGLASINAAEVTAQIDGIEGLNVVATSTQHPGFTGVKTDTAVADGALQLDTSILFDSGSGNFDSALGDFDGGGGTIQASGEYAFDAPIDLGSIYTSRVTAQIEISRIDYVNTFDAAEGLFDDRPGQFDGDVQTFDDTNVQFFVSITNEDPAGSPVWTPWQQFTVSDYTARAFRFKVLLTTTDPQATPAISVLSVTVDMPDRIISGNDIASGTGAGGYVVTFARAFKAVPALGIAAQNLQQGDYYEIPSKSASAFTIRFKNSSGTVVSRTFDYVARGYGSLVP